MTKLKEECSLEKKLCAQLYEAVMNKVQTDNISVNQLADKLGLLPSGVRLLYCLSY